MGASGRAYTDNLQSGGPQLLDLSSHLRGPSLPLFSFPFLWPYEVLLRILQ